MRSKNPEIMNRISEFAGNYYRNNHASPTIREIAEGIGISKSTVHSYLEEMDEKKLLSYGGRKNISNIPKISKTPQGYFSAPVVGSVRCGDPENEEEEVEMYLSLPEAIFGTGDFYMVRAMGDSMVDAGINDGDYVVVKEQPVANNGDIVVAILDDGATVKRFYKEKDHIRLQPENDNMEPIIVKDCKILGTVFGVFRLY